jgi:hypothetical protein
VKKDWQFEATAETWESERERGSEADGVEVGGDEANEGGTDEHMETRSSEGSRNRVSTSAMGCSVDRYSR